MENSTPAAGITVNTNRNRLARLCLAIDRMSIWIGKMVSGVILLLVGSMTYEVAARYIFNAPTSWSMEMSTFLFAGIWIFCGAWTHQVDGHIKVDVIYNRFSKRGRAILDSISIPILLFFIVITIWQLLNTGLKSVSIMEHSGSQWSPPIYIVKMALPVGGILLGLQVVSTSIRSFYLAITGRELK